jgi:hypothetical protein
MKQNFFVFALLLTDCLNLSNAKAVAVALTFDAAGAVASVGLGEAASSFHCKQRTAQASCHFPAS